MQLREISIGRDPKCDIVIPAQFQWVSSRHAVIYNTPDGSLIFKDVSRNGTVINGEHICNAERRIAPGQMIVLANKCVLPWDVIYSYFPNASANAQTGVYNQHGSAPTSVPGGGAQSPAPQPQQQPQQRQQPLTEHPVDENFLSSWNWGAFLMYPIWGFTNGCWWAFLLSFFGIIGSILFGIMGSRWSWNNKKWNNFYEFRIAQRTWKQVALTNLFFIIGIIVLIIIMTLIIGIGAASALSNILS